MGTCSSRSYWDKTLMSAVFSLEPCQNLQNWLLPSLFRAFSFNTVVSIAWLCNPYPAECGNLHETPWYLLSSNPWCWAPVEQSSSISSRNTKWKNPIWLLDHSDKCEMQDLASCLKISFLTSYTESRNIPASAICKRYINWQVDKKERKLFQVIITATKSDLLVNLKNSALNLWILL